MGRVYLAHDVVLDRVVALKVLREDLARGEEFVSRFRREARAAASLSHENVVRIFDTGFGDDGVPYISMEYVPGGTVAERLKREGPLPPGEAARIARETALALHAAHEGGIVHRDIKPHNVFLTERSRVKVGDFGIARAAGATALTQASLVFGTARYISPEVAEGEPATPRSDLYSLGVVLYEMLTGRPPFEAENALALAMRHVTEDAVPPRALVPSVPEALDDATMRLLAKDPAERPASALAAASAIEGTEYPTRREVLRPVDDIPGRSPGTKRVPYGRPPARSRRRALLSAGVLCALLAAVALPTALPTLLQPGGEGPLARALLSSWGDAGARGSGPLPRLASPLGEAEAAPEIPRAPENGREDAPEPQDPSGSLPARPEGGTPASAGQYQYVPQYVVPDEEPQHGLLPAPAGPEVDPAPAPAMAPAPEPEAKQPDPVPPKPDPVRSENTAPPLGPEEADEVLTVPDPDGGPAAPQEEAAEEIVESVQEQVEGITPGFSFDDEAQPLGKNQGSKEDSGERVR
jgi:serine/threonine-protein kinase